MLADTQIFQSVVAASTQTLTTFLRLISYISGDFSPIRETWLLLPKLLQRGFLKFEVSNKLMFSADSISFFSADEKQGSNKPSKCLFAIFTMNNTNLIGF